MNHFLCPETKEPCETVESFCRSACHAKMVRIMRDAEKRGWRGVHIDTSSDSPTGLIGIPPPPQAGSPVNVPAEF